MNNTDLSIGVQLLGRKTLLHTNNSTDRRWSSNPGPCRKHDHCYKRTQPLRHLNQNFRHDKTILVCSESASSNQLMSALTYMSM